MATWNVVTRTDPPAVDVFIGGLPTGTKRVRIYRTWQGNTREVRGDGQVSIVDLQTRIEDYDIPLDVPVSYRVRAFNATGAELSVTGQVDSDPIQLDGPGRNFAWLSDPLSPELSIVVELMRDTDTNRAYDSNTVVALPIGSTLPVAIMDARAAASGIPYRMIAPDFDTSDAIQQIIAPGGVLLLRPARGLVRHRTGLIYLLAPSVVETPRRDLAVAGRSDWSFTGQEVRPPSIGVLAPIRTYTDVKAESTNYAGVVATYSSYLALLRG